MKKSIVFGLISVILLLGSAFTVSISTTQEKTSSCSLVVPDKAEPYKVKTGSELLIIHGSTAGVVPVIGNKTELLQFVQQNKERLNALKNGEIVSATITFKRPLRKYEVLRLLGNNVKIIAVRYKSYPEGIGQMPYPMEVEESERLMKLEEHLRKELKEKNGIKDFKLIEGFISAKVIAPKEELVRIANLKDVLDINVGPRDVAEKHGVKSMLIEDIWWEYEKYILKENNK
ncbi:hypothetical protein GBV73_08580 [Thermococcus sp. 101 C5]|uniref:hypothetical protein n=1 Tax=Thermococcus TaxID=2263 RepID=UPI00128E7AFA|nr:MULTISPECIES: hypothetical protein [Thermococcus]MCA6214855.1 hypothetical protein [Thermococcus bergensis]MPW39725.1 hypothetical protein [Thermococcus sp. 101 C5]